MKSPAGVVRLPWHEAIAPVTILDALGKVVRVVPAKEFRGPAPASHGHSRERRRRLSRRAPSNDGVVR
jgi:hypothetical protein